MDDIHSVRKKLKVDNRTNVIALHQVVQDVFEKDDLNELARSCLEDGLWDKLTEEELAEACLADGPWEGTEPRENRQSTTHNDSGLEIWVSPFDALSDEVLVMIFGFVPFFRQCRIRRVCKRWNEILPSPPVLRHIVVDFVAWSKLNGRGSFHYPGVELESDYSSFRLRKNDEDGDLEDEEDEDVVICRPHQLDLLDDKIGEFHDRVRARLLKLKSLLQGYGPDVRLLTFVNCTITYSFSDPLSIIASLLTENSFSALRQVSFSGVVFRGSTSWSTLLLPETVRRVCFKGCDFEEKFFANFWGAPDNFCVVLGIRKNDQIIMELPETDPERTVMFWRMLNDAAKSLHVWSRQRFASYDPDWDPLSSCSDSAKYLVEQIHRARLGDLEFVPKILAKLEPQLQHVVDVKAMDYSKIKFLTKRILVVLCVRE